MMWAAFDKTCGQIDVIDNDADAFLVTMDDNKIVEKLDDLYLDDAVNNGFALHDLHKIQASIALAEHSIDLVLKCYTDIAIADPDNADKYQTDFEKFVKQVDNLEEKFFSIVDRDSDLFDPFAQNDK